MLHQLADDHPCTPYAKGVKRRQIYEPSHAVATPCPENFQPNKFGYNSALPAVYQNKPFDADLHSPTIVAKMAEIEMTDSLNGHKKGWFSERVANSGPEIEETRISSRARAYVL
jgi:hypothetical protein